MDTQSTGDTNTVRALIKTMESEHMSHLGPNEVRPFLEAAKQQRALMLLARHFADPNASRSETAHLLDPITDHLDIHDVNYYLKLLNAAAIKLSVSREDLRNLYFRLQNDRAASREVS